MGIVANLRGPQGPPGSGSTPPNVLYYTPGKNAAVDEAPILNALIAGAKSGTVIQCGPGNIYISSAIELNSNVILDGIDPGSCFITARAGYADSQLVRNWHSTDWTSSETDHYLAPNHTAAPCYYPKIRNMGIQLLSHCTGVTALALVHPQERALIDNIIVYDTGTLSTNCVPLAVFANLDPSYSIAGIVPFSRLVCYGGSTTHPWKHLIHVDGTNGGKMDFSMLRGSSIDVSAVTMGYAPSCSDSPFLFVGVYQPIINRWHTEGSIANDTTTGQQTFTDFTGSSGSVITSAGSYVGSNEDRGRSISDGGVNIPAGTVIASVSSNGLAITLSNALTGSVAGRTITLGPDTAIFRFKDCPGAVIRDCTWSPDINAVHRPFMRATSGNLYGPGAGQSPLLDNIKMVKSGATTGLVAGANVIEDYTCGSNVVGNTLIPVGPGAIPFNATTCDPRQIYRYDGSTFLFRNTASGAIFGNNGYLTPLGGPVYTKYG